MLEQKIEINQFYDFYSQLLKPKQRALLEMYYLDDWSLAEIAEHQGVSRQAIFESLKRIQTALNQFEQKLHLVEKHRQRQQLADQMRQRLQSYPDIKTEVESWIEEWLMID